MTILFTLFFLSVLIGPPIFVILFLNRFEDEECTDDTPEGGTGI